MKFMKRAHEREKLELAELTKQFDDDEKERVKKLKKAAKLSDDESEGADEVLFVLCLCSLPQFFLT